MRFGQFDSTMCKGTVWAQPITAFSAIFNSRHIFITHFTNLALNFFTFLKSLINIPKHAPPCGKKSTLPVYSWCQIYSRQQGQVELNSGKWGKGPFLVQLSSELVFPCTPGNRHVDNQTVFLKNNESSDWFDRS